MNKGDTIKCADLNDLVTTSFKLKDEGVKFDVSVKKSTDEYLIFITEDCDD